MRTLLVLAILVRQAAAEPEPTDGAHWFVMSTSEALFPGVGAGGELVRGGNAITVDGSIVGLPICFGRCEWFYGAGGSAAYRRQITERFFVGLRVGARYWNDTPDHEGWMRSGYVELGARGMSGSWMASAALGAGVATWADQSHSLALAFRGTFGR